MVDGPSSAALRRNSGLNVLLVAEESAGVRVLRLLAEGGHKVVGVLSTPPGRTGGGAVATVALELGVVTLDSRRVVDPALATWIRDEQVDLLLNVHSLFVIDAYVLEAPRIGSFNLHPGRLPEYAGLNAPSWSIYCGETTHAVTLHWMEKEIDVGPVAYASSFPIDEVDTGLSLTLKGVRMGLPLVARLLEAAARGREAVPVHPQDPSRRRYFGPEVPDGGRILWGRPARKIVDLVRACDYAPYPSPWGQASARLGDRTVAIVKASRTGTRASDPAGTVGDADGPSVSVAAADEWIRVHSVGVEGSVLPASDLLERGARLADGV